MVRFLCIAWRWLFGRRAAVGDFGIGRQAPIDPHAAGRFGEDLAATWFERQGYRVLARNFRWPAGELDAVVQREDVVAVVEVKTRHDNAFQRGVDAVDVRKQDHLQRTYAEFARRRHLDRVFVRYDILVVVLDTEHRVKRVEHYPRAFEPSRKR